MKKLSNLAGSMAMLAILAATPSLALQQITLEQLLQKNEDSAGGTDAIAKVKTLRVTATALFSEDPAAVPITISLKRPNLGRTDVTSKGKTLESGFDGSTAWAVNPATGAAEKVELDSGATNSLTSFQIDVLLGSVRGMIVGQQAELIGIEALQTSNAFHIKASRKDGVVTDYYVDSASFQLVKIAASVTQAGEVQEIESYPSDYRKLNGLTIPYAMDVKSAGQWTFHLQVQQFQLNPAVDDGIFQMSSIAKAPPK